MSVPWRLQKGGKLMGWYRRVIHRDSRCGIDLSHDSTSIPPVKSAASPQNPIGKSTFSALPGAERRHHKAPLRGALKISAPLRGEPRTFGARRRARSVHPGVETVEKRLNFFKRGCAEPRPHPGRSSPSAVTPSAHPEGAAVPRQPGRVPRRYGTTREIDDATSERI